jgi:hypothetical protein
MVRATRRPADVLQILVEVNLGCCRDTVGALPKEHLIKEQRHDLLLRELLFDLVCEEGLAQLSCEQLLARKEVVARQLLRERAATARNLTTLQKAYQRPANTLVINARMLEEAPVLGGDKCPDDVIRQIIESNQNAAALPDFGYQIAITTEYSEWDLQRDVTDRLGGRQSRGHVVISADNGGNHANCCGYAQSGSDKQPAGPSAPRLVVVILVRFCCVLHSCWRCMWPLGAKGARAPPPGLAINQYAGVRSMQKKWHFAGKWPMNPCVWWQMIARERYSPQ